MQVVIHRGATAILIDSQTRSTSGTAVPPINQWSSAIVQGSLA
jgi:hypothetical protein